MSAKIHFAILALLPVLLLRSSAADPSTQPTAPTYIDISRAPAPLFDDPVFHGASDPFVIWNPVRGQWFMYYTQRRATLANANGVDWVHGSAIGIAGSADGLTWKYLGTCQGDHDLSDPLKAKGLGPEPGVTWWAPCLIHEGNLFHMWVTQVDGVYTTWAGNRNILHFTSNDGINWKFINTAALHSNRVIDPTVYKIADNWYMVYKDEASGSHTYLSKSKNLLDWTDAVIADRDGSQEAPFVFHWKNAWWLIVDALGNKGLRIYQSPTGIDQWEYNNTVLSFTDGTRSKDNSVGHHPGMVIQTQPDGSEQCLLFYFTHQRNKTVIQVAELDQKADGKVVCDRNKYSR
jgi:predicted GH43/DUF377 family glycosyl hydrolase